MNDASGVSFQDTGVLSLLAGGGGRRGGILGNDDVGADVLAAGAVANGTAVNAKVEQVSNQVQMASIGREFDRLSDESTANERRNSDQNQETRDRVADMRAEFKDCCCETQKEIAALRTDTLLGQKDTEIRNLRDQADAERRADNRVFQSQTNDTLGQLALAIAAMNNGNGHSRS